MKGFWEAASEGVVPPKVSSKVPQKDTEELPSHKSSQPFWGEAKSKADSEEKLESLPWFTKRIENAFAKGAIDEIKSIVSTYGPVLVRDFINSRGEQFKDKLQEFFPTGESFIEGVAGRAGKTVPYAIGGPGTMAIGPGRAVTGAVLGETAKHLGAPEWAQSGLEIAAQGAPTFGKKIVPTAGQKAVVEFGRKLGLTEEQITPLIQSEKKQNFLAKLVPKGERTQKILKDTKQAIGRIYEKLRLRPEATEVFTPEQVNRFIEDLDPIFRELPNTLRNEVRKDLLDVVKDGFTGSALINFWQDLNLLIASNPKLSKLGTMKGAIAKALERVSPELGQDFTMTNQLYQKYFPIAERLKPSVKEQILSAGRVLFDLFSVATGNVYFIGERIGERALKQVSKQLLLNPRFQNIGKQIVDSLNSGKYAMATRAAQEFVKELKKSSPEVAEELNDTDFTKLSKINHHQK